MWSSPTLPLHRAHNSAQWLLGLILLAFSLATQADSMRWVDDRAELLPIDERQALASELSAFANRQAANVYVVTLPKLGTEGLEGHAKRLLSERTSSTGQRASALILVALAERQVRILTNAAMRTRLSDEQATQIIQQDIAPAFQREAYRQGIRLAVRSSMDAILDTPSTASNTYGPWWMLSLAACVACLIFSWLWRRRTGKALMAAAAMGTAATAATGAATMGAFACALCAMVALIQKRKQHKRAQPHHPSVGAKARPVSYDHRNDDDKGGSEGGRDGGASGGW